MKVIGIMMTDTDGVCAVNDKLPLSLPEDLKFFKKTTMGHPILMGYKTMNTLPGALPGRDNFVLNTRGDSCEVKPGFTLITRDALLDMERNKPKNEKIFIIGGPATIDYIDDLFGFDEFFVSIAKQATELDGDKLYFPTTNSNLFKNNHDKKDEIFMEVFLTTPTFSVFHYIFQEKE